MKITETEFIFELGADEIKGGNNKPIIYSNKEHKIKYCKPCQCEPKLYHWCDNANPNVHGYFWGCKNHGISTLHHDSFKSVNKLKQEWYEGKVVKDKYIEQSYEVL